MTIDDLRKAHIKLGFAQRNQLMETLNYQTIRGQIEQESGKVYDENLSELVERPKE